MRLQHGGEKKPKREEFEFCKVCNLNQDQGRRHKYFPTHIKALSRFFSRFEAKISTVLFSLRNPTLLPPDCISCNRIWCVFCDSDIKEEGSCLACNNIITHLASTEHLKALKHFLWKYGDRTDRLDAFRISQEDFLKWKKKCKLLRPNLEDPYVDAFQPKLGAGNDIHNEVNYENKTNTDKNIISSFASFCSTGVVPLPYYTNERYWISHSEVSSMEHLHQGSMTSLPVESKTSLVGFKDLSASSEANGNVHSGAPPPWLGAAEGKHVDAQGKSGLENLASSSAGKSRKLNPQRVGAAWAERRKIEIEMEKMGKITESKFDDDWLPNFGSVWQTGTRKESRREFVKEKKKFCQSDTQADMPILLQPYVSKRMRNDEGG